MFLSKCYPNNFIKFFYGCKVFYKKKLSEPVYNPFAHVPLALVFLQDE